VSLCDVVRFNKVNVTSPVFMHFAVACEWKLQREALKSLLSSRCLLLAAAPIAAGHRAVSRPVHAAASRSVSTNSLLLCSLNDRYRV
jgi:hypothetical protein